MLKTPSILIVEDDALIAEDLKLTLLDLGFNVAGIATNFNDGVTLADSQRPDLVLLDINLSSDEPANNGLALARRLNDDYGLPFLFLTAYTDRETILEATRLRPSGYLIKPTTPAALFATIQTTIESLHSRSGTDAMPTADTDRPDFFFVKVGSRNIKLLWKDVYCLESSKNYVQIRVVGVPVTYSIRGTLGFVRQQLMPAGLQPMFVQFNRSTIVNLRHITYYDVEGIHCLHFQTANTRFSYRELQTLMAQVRVALEH